MLIITAEERLKEKRGVKMLLLGPAGIGKTTEAKTLDLKTTLYVNIEDGDHCLAGTPISTAHVRTWSELRDVACLFGGSDDSVAANSCYSKAHYDAVTEKLGDPARFTTVMIDSITAGSRLCLKHAEQQPEAVARNGSKDTRAIYGIVAREMCAMAVHLQRARDKNIVLVGILERHVDDLNVATWQLQADGAKFAREIVGVVDNVVVYRRRNAAACVRLHQS
jgi:hypothetical protein